MPVNFIHFCESRSIIRVLALALTLACSSCWGADPTKINSPKKISFQKQGSSYNASFVHENMDLRKDGIYFIPVAISSADTDEFLRSLKITDAGGTVQSYSFHLEEEVSPVIDERLLNVFEGDDFKVADFQRLLLGKQVTIVAKRDGISAEIVAEADRNDAQAAVLSSKVTASVPTTVTVTGQMLGLSAQPGTVKLLVTVDSGTQIVEIKQDSVVSLQSAAGAVVGLPEALELRQLQAANTKRLILTISEDITDATISYEYDLSEAYEIEAIGDLSRAPVQLTLTGWIKLRNTTPWAWQDIQVTLVTKDASDHDYVLKNVTLGEGKIVRLPLPQPTRTAWTLPGDLYLLVAPAPDGAHNLAVELKLNVYNRPGPSAMPILADRLLIREGGRALQAIEDHTEIPISSSPQSLSLGISKAIEVHATRRSHVPIFAEAISAADGNIVICRDGRISLYNITYKGADPLSVLPVRLVRSNALSYAPLEQPGQYMVKPDAIHVVGKKSSLQLIELHEPHITLGLPITEARTDSEVGGLQWLALYAKSPELGQVLINAAAIRSDIDQFGEELVLLKNQLLTLQNRQSAYLSEPQTKYHGAIIRQLEDLIYAKKKHIEDQQSELTTRKHQLDRLASRSAGIR